MGYKKKLVNTILDADNAKRLKRAADQGFDTDKVLYHASQQDIKKEFVPGYDDGLIFTTDNQKFANDWLGLGKYRGRVGAEDEIEALREADRALRREIFDYDALNKLDKDEFNKAYDLAQGKYDAVKDLRADDVYKTVYPLNTKAKNTFDPRKDYKKIEPFLVENMGLNPKDGLHKEGNWLIYERKEVVDELKRMGYDSMRIKEMSDVGAPHNTLAIFNPADIRSTNAQFDPANIGKNDIMGSIDPKVLAALGLGSGAAAAIKPGAGNYAAATLQGIGHMPKMMTEELARFGGYANSGLHQILSGKSSPFPVENVDRDAKAMNDWYWKMAEKSALTPTIYNRLNEKAATEVLNPKTEAAKANILQGAGGFANQLIEEVGPTREGQAIKSAYNTLMPIYRKLPKALRGLLESL